MKVKDLIEKVPEDFEIKICKGTVGIDFEACDTEICDIGYSSKEVLLDTKGNNTRKCEFNEENLKACSENDWDCAMCCHMKDTKKQEDLK